LRPDVKDEEILSSIINKGIHAKNIKNVNGSNHETLNNKPLIMASK
jgi:hypothetical protein